MIDVIRHRYQHTASIGAHNWNIYFSRITCSKIHVFFLVILKLKNSLKWKKKYLKYLSFGILMDIKTFTLEEYNNCRKLIFKEAVTWIKSVSQQDYIAIRKVADDVLWYLNCKREKYEYTPIKDEKYIYNILQTFANGQENDDYILQMRLFKKILNTFDYWRLSRFFILNKQKDQPHIRHCDVIDAMIANNFEKIKAINF